MSKEFLMIEVFREVKAQVQQQSSHYVETGTAFSKNQAKK